MKSMRPASTVFGTALAVFAAYSLGGCPTPAPKPPIFDASDATTPVTDAASVTDAGALIWGEDVVVIVDNDDPTEAASTNPTCVRACLKLKELGCPEAQKPDGGKTCYRVCVDSEPKFSLKPVCVANAKTVVELKACKTVRCMK